MDGFRYDAWANARWAPSVRQMGEPAAKVFQHVLNAQTIWYGRCVEETPELPAATDEALAAMGEHWAELIRISDPTAFASYTRADGEMQFMMVEDIARHVINHGTYHRGQLRAMAEAAGVEFPETDYIIYRRETGSE